MSFLQSGVGFTLLEILLVLFLFSLVAGMVFPRAVGIYERFQARVDRDEVEARIADLGLHAMQEGRGFRLISFPVEEGQDPVPLELPEGWSLQAQSAIRYRDNGVCDGGVLVISGPDLTYTVNLLAPFCQPTVQ